MAHSARGLFSLVVRLWAASCDWGLGGGTHHYRCIDATPGPRLSARGILSSSFNPGREVGIQVQYLDFVPESVGNTILGISIDVKVLKAQDLNGASQMLRRFINVFLGSS